MRSSWVAVILVLAMSLHLTACGTAGTPSAAPEPPAGRTFTDDLGREVPVPQQITRILPSAALAQIVLLSIAPDLFVGLASEVHTDAQGILPGSVLELPCFGSLSSGSGPNVEELTLAAPQLIIDIGEPKDSTADALDALQRQTLIPCVYICASLDSLPDTYRKLGQLLGREERAETLARFCETVYTRTAAVMEQVGEDRVDSLYILGEEGLNVIAAGSYHAELLDLLTNNLAVVDNPLSKGTGNEVTMDQIALWDPEFIIFAPGSIYSTVHQTPVWDRLDAIVSRNYVQVPDVPYNWMGMPPSVQRCLGLIWLTAELYPNHCGYDVKAEIMEYYRLFYGCTLTDAQYSAITANAFRRN